ncbi:MAG: hypothetical protein GKS04_00340 [Candidatus Mycalebacterium zealandia]|nr:MAG: hypothetical protein GKS04_00340 [Candidatus Mycalebacterium zealandia]
MSFFFKAFLVCCAVVAVVAGYMRLRVEKVVLAYEISENVRKEKLLIEEAAAAELLYTEVFSSEKLRDLAAKKGFREPGRQDFIYESEPGLDEHPR